MNVPLILGGVGLCLYSLTFLICISMVIFIFTSIRPSKSNVPILLTCNTYLTLCLFATIMLVMYAYNEYGNLNSSVWLDGRWCQIRSYLAHVCLCAVYYSFVLQAIFRLFRIVFFKHRILQSFGVCILAVIIQWIISFLFILPTLLLNDFQYLPHEYSC
jgi:hypothetical protein